MSRLALMNSLPVRSDDADFFAADARKFYRHADQPIFLLLLWQFSSCCMGKPGRGGHGFSRAATGHNEFRL